MDPQCVSNRIDHPAPVNIADWFKQFVSSCKVADCTRLAKLAIAANLLTTALHCRAGKHLHLDK